MIIAVYSEQRVAFAARLPSHDLINDLAWRSEAISNALSRVRKRHAVSTCCVCSACIFWLNARLSVGHHGWSAFGDRGGTGAPLLSNVGSLANPCSPLRSSRPGSCACARRAVYERELGKPGTDADKRRVW